MTAPKITPFLWYARDAEAAAALYTRVFPDSRIRRVVAMAAESPSGPPGSVKVVDFELFGQPMTAMTAAGAEGFNHAVSFSIACDTQEELDRYWDALLADGGTPEACGWLRDRFGVCWQLVPSELAAWMSSTDAAQARRTAEAMMSMVKFDIAALRAAFDGTR